MSKIKIEGPGPHKFENCRFEPNPFKRDEREDMRRFWWNAVFVCGTGFWLCIAAAALWGRL
jgi:hypothetical protein